MSEDARDDRHRAGAAPRAPSPGREGQVPTGRHRRSGSDPDLPPRSRSVAILVVSGIVVLLSVGLGVGVIGALSGGGFDASGTESARTAEQVRRDFGVGDTDVVVLARARTGTVDDAAARTAGRKVTAELTDTPEVESVGSYWDTAAGGDLGSHDRRSALVVVQLAGSQNDKSEWLRRAHERYDDRDGALELDLGGNAEVFRAIQDQVTHDLVISEAVTVPLSMILLLFVFRSVVAAVLPLALGALSACVTLLVLRVLTTFTEVSIFALNLTSALALGLGIDYGLLIVTRFREELAAGRSTGDALRRTTATAGRTVVFSGVTVALSLGTLLIFPLPFLRSFGYAAIPVVVVTVAGAVLVVPAILALLGPRVDRWSLGRLPALNARDETWERSAGWMIRHRAPVAVIGVGMLLLLAVPFRHVQIGKSDDRVLPAGADVRQVQQDIRKDFDGNLGYPTTVLATGPGTGAGQVTRLDQVAAAISALPHVGLVRGGSGVWVDGRRAATGGAPPGQARDGVETAYLSVILAPDTGVYSPEAITLVKAIRAMPAPYRLAVTGESARLVDDKTVIARLVPVALGIIAVVSLILIFLLTGSVVVPVKALTLNLLSLTATFGVMVWGFQEGHLQGLLGFTSSGYLDQAMPVLLFCLAFGLSMDYELFLVSRIREEYVRTGDNDRAVVTGIGKTASVFTSAAVLLSVVFSGLIVSLVSFLKMAGLGVVLAVLMDAVVIRSALVPSLMSMMGRFNWWAPGPLRRLHARIGVSESSLDLAPGGPPARAAAPSRPAAAAAASNGRISPRPVPPPVRHGPRGPA